MAGIFQFFHHYFPGIKATLKLLKALAPLGAVVVFAIALWQYVRSESWKKTEFVAKLFKEFSDNEGCRIGRSILEGDSRKIYYKQGDKYIGYKYNYNLLCRMIDNAINDIPLTPAQLNVRDSLDEFFIYIEQFERAIQRKLVTQDDVYPYLGYWIGVLKGDPGMSPDKATLDKIIAYIDYAWFDDVKAFLDREWDAEPESVLARCSKYGRQLARRLRDRVRDIRRDTSR